MSRDYEPTLSVKDEPLDPFSLAEIYPGVRGYAISHNGAIYIPVIEGDGTGKVGEMLDRLTPRCRIASVVSARLRGMLERRGWAREWESTEDGDVDVWRPPA